MTDEESFRRGVFPYEVAGSPRLGDPLKVLGRMHEALPAFDDLVDRFFAEPPPDLDRAAREARDWQMIELAAAIEPAVLAGFNLPPLADDGSGVTTTEAMALLADLLGWQSRKEAARVEAESRKATLAAEAHAREVEAAEAAVVGEPASA